MVIIWYMFFRRALMMSKPVLKLSLRNLRSSLHFCFAASRAETALARSDERVACSSTRLRYSARTERSTCVFSFFFSRCAISSLRTDLSFSSSSSLEYEGRPTSHSCSSPKSLEKLLDMSLCWKDEMYLRHVLIGQLAQLLVEVSLLLLKLAETLLALLKLVPHFNFYGAGFVQLYPLLIKLFLNCL
ncbi:uncharacterized protein K460DRAFT_152571 [Cucurbitaria berberidis CBS 394.84]|uniref:Uncharacterized protein n=1 Tax=Cucurbitaria berberidis CBS 394.84 TaxID=1168544 RepID=A0A9P4GE18_9PLEO|nr:uncharacterized protein K460DRAFT_152571 [Cucurbitaria berberidis CBS 394.84]KAF1843855.1 hypothetical protein K460DRAFT_152571 [Cucurbitaria berberidis CBS 394.84]